jgi:hypothetical protein
MVFGLLQALSLNGQDRVAPVRQDGYLVFTVPPGRSTAVVGGFCLNQDRRIPSAGSGMQLQARPAPEIGPASRIAAAAARFMADLDAWRKTLAERGGQRPEELDEAAISPAFIYRVAQQAVWHITDQSEVPLGEGLLGTATETLMDAAGVPIPFAQSAEDMLHEMARDARRGMAGGRDARETRQEFLRYVCAYRVLYLMHSMAGMRDVLTSLHAVDTYPGLTQLAGAIGLSDCVEGVWICGRDGRVYASSKMGSPPVPVGLSTRQMTVARRDEGGVSLVIPTAAGMSGPGVFVVVCKATERRETLNRMAFLGNNGDRWHDLHRELDAQAAEDLLRVFAELVLFRLYRNDVQGLAGLLGEAAGPTPPLADLVLLNERGNPVNVVSLTLARDVALQPLLDHVRLGWPPTGDFRISQGSVTQWVGTPLLQANHFSGVIAGSLCVAP